MTPQSFLIIFSAVILNALSQIVLKFASANITQLTKNVNLINVISFFFSWPVLTGLLFYLISFVLWIFALSKVEVSIAYPMLSIGYILVTLFAWFFFNEPLSISKFLAIFLIVAGVVTLVKA